MTTNLELQIINKAIAEGWDEDLELMYKGVNLADAMEYDVLRVVGRQLVIDKQKRETSEAEK